MHYIVFGAGAIGCYVGGRLAAQGHAVTLVGRCHTLGPIAAQGLRVTDLDGYDHTVPPTALYLCATLAEALELAQKAGGDCTVLLCVKSGATAAAAQDLAAQCPPGTTVISLQNGVDNVAQLQAVAPQLQVLAGMVPYNVVLRGTHVHRATSGLLHLQHHPATLHLAPVWGASGLPLVLSHDIRAVQWGKLLLNLNNPVNALCDMPLRQQLLDRDCRYVLAALQTEALRAMAKAGIRPAQVATVPASWLPHVMRLPNWLFARLGQRMLRMDAQARSSMWDDLEAGRVTEIDALCGAVVRLAAQQGMAAPLNARMCELLSGSRQRLSGAALRQLLGV